MSMDYPLSEQDFLAYDADELASYPVQDEYMEFTDDLGEDLGEELGEDLGDTDSETDDEQEEEEEQRYNDLQSNFTELYSAAFASEYGVKRRAARKIVEATLKALKRRNDYEGLAQVADVIADVRNVVGPRLGPEAIANMEFDLEKVRKERTLARARETRRAREAVKAREYLARQWQEAEALEAAQAASGV